LEAGRLTARFFAGSQRSKSYRALDMKNIEMLKVAAFASEMKRGVDMVRLLVSLAITDILSQRRRGVYNREPQGGALARNAGGFSLAELLVVLSIIGVIASALVVPIYQIFAYQSGQQ